MTPTHATQSSLRTRVKFCGLTRAADVEAAVHAGADAIGFVLYPASPRAVTPAQAAELVQLLPPFITPVLLMVNPSASEVAAALQAIPQALLQFHGDETPEQCWQLSQQGRQPFIRAARIPIETPVGQAPFDLVEYANQFSQAQAILLDAHVAGYGGGGQVFNWSLLPTNVTSHLVLSGGLTPSNVIDGIDQLRHHGLSLAVDVSSGIEATGPDGKTRKGIKDAEKMFRFMAAVAQADAQARACHTRPAQQDER